MKLTKAGLADHVFSQRCTSTCAEAAETVDLVFETMKARLADGESLKLSGFGTFTVADKATRMGRNPQTGAPIKIAKRRVVRFTAGKALKQAVK